MKTPNLTRYVCDRCGKTSYLPNDDTTSPEARTWYAVKRMTGDISQSDCELCETCHTAYTQLLTRQTTEYDAWLKSGDGKETAK